MDQLGDGMVFMTVFRFQGPAVAAQSGDWEVTDALTRGTVRAPPTHSSREVPPTYCRVGTTTYLTCTWHVCSACHLYMPHERESFSVLE